MNYRYGLAIALVLASIKINAAPVQTFSGELIIGDNLNTASNLIGRLTGRNLPPA